MGYQKKLIILTGPTASGKSGLALECAAKLKGVIINGDAMQVYQELPILTAQPKLENGKSNRILHLLYGMISGRENFSVAQWLQHLEGQLHHSWHQGLVPIIVGGSGMYLQRLLQGLAPIPAISIDVQRQAEAILNHQGKIALHELLASEDRAKLHPNDTIRTMRSYGVYHTTGESLHYWQQQKVVVEILRDVAVVKIAIIPNREQLYSICNQRLEDMLQKGAIAEVEKIMNYPSALPIQRAIGVVAIKKYLQGEFDYATALREAQKQTRHYAKRQYTWIRHQFCYDLSLESTNRDQMLEFLAHGGYF